MGNSDASEFKQKNKKAGSAFTGLSWFAFILMIVNLPLLYLIEKPAMSPFTWLTEDNVWIVNGVFGIVTWIFLTSNWGSWNAQNCCGNADLHEKFRAGSSFNCAVTVWV